MSIATVEAQNMNLQQQTMTPPPEPNPRDPMIAGVPGNGDAAVQPTDTSVPAPAASGQDGNPWIQRVTDDGLVKGVAFDWLQDLTRRVASVEQRVKEEEKQAAEDSKNIKDGNPQSLKRVPRVRDCNWEQFKNRYDPEEGIPAVETLMTGQDLDREMEEEQLRRLDLDAKKDFLAAEGKNPAKRTQPGKNTVDDRIDRVRINSRAVMSLLAEVTGQSTWKSDQPHVFFTPFKIPIYFHDVMEKELEKLAAALSPTEGLESGQALAPASTDAAEGQKSPVLSEDTETAHQAYLEIKCYVEFVRDRLLTVHHKFDAETHETRIKIKFPELWSLFRFGELVVERQQDGSDPRSSRARQRQMGTKKFAERRVWKVFLMMNGVGDWGVDNLDAPGSVLRRGREVEGDQDFRIWAYRLDYDGAKYSAVEKRFNVSSFEKEKDITKLPVYPIRFQKDYESMMKRLQKRGEKFQQLINCEHRAIEHDGWTLLEDGSGNQLPGPTDDMRLATAHIDSNVIIDFAEGFQSHPQWKPDFMAYSNEVWGPSSKQDLFAVIQWSGPDRTRELSRIIEIVIEDDDVNELQWQKLAETDNFIVNSEQRAERFQDLASFEEEKQVLTDEDAALLPARVMVYSLRERYFVNADIHSLKIPTEIPDPFADLRIEASDKNLIRSVVRDHFEKKRINRQLQNRGDEKIEQDFIPGKGKGLIILLHGPPGVGKTATAEAVAYAHNKPLFPITCGDLGVEPNTVEERLSRIFRLANTWDCVLLLDEADIFLSRREKMDDSLQRNALVSVFLRALEYYPGVLFLTTNRVGVLDEALSSRVHISLFFRHLSLSQTHGLFQTNLARTKLIAEQRADVRKEPVLIIREHEIMAFAMERFQTHLQVNPNAPWWNGRQIRNAFQIATSLAYAEPEMPEGTQRYLDRSHFEQVHSAIQDFTDYRSGVHKKNEDELAAEREERGPTREPRPTHRRYESSRYEGGRSRSPMTYTQPPPPQPSQFQAPPHSRDTPERSREPAYYSSPPPPDSSAYGGPSTPSRHPSEQPLHAASGYAGPPPQGGHLLAPSGHAASRMYNDNQYSGYRGQEQETYTGRHA